MSQADVEVAFGPLLRFTERKIRSIILGAAANLTEDTPVDTGHAANNWIPSLDAPSTAIAGSREAPDSGAQSAGIAAVAGYRLPQVGYVANNVPYIGALNDGHSKQAPTGFVQSAVVRAVRQEAEKP